MTRESDETLLDRIVHGDESAFVALYRRHSQRIYRFVYGMCGVRSIAEDCTQEVFLNVLEKAGGYKKFSGPARPWLYGIARHKVIDKLRQRGRMEFGLDAAQLSDNAETPDQHVVAYRRTAELNRAIVALPIRYREVIVLCELEELSYAEAAGLLECPVGTVRSRLHRGREMLAGKLRTRADTAKQNLLSGGQLGEG